MRIENDDVEARQEASDEARSFDLKGSLRAVRVVPGLLALLLFSTFNNFGGSVFMALMDPYGLDLVSVETWGTAPEPMPSATGSEQGAQGAWP
jgi:hypothetical protein